MKTMYVDIRVGSILKIGDAVVTLQNKSGRVARLAVQVPDGTRITHPGAQECASLQEEPHGQHPL